MGSTARRATGTIAAGAVALAAAALLVSASQYGEIALAVLAIVVAVGALQVLVGLAVIGGDQPLERGIADRASWGAGWVLDGTRAIGLAVAVWMLFAPDARPLAPAGWIVLAAVLLAQPFSRRLDSRAVPALAPGTYVVRTAPAPPVLPLLRVVEPARPRVLHAVRVGEPSSEPRVLHAVAEPRRLPRVDVRL